MTDDELLYLPATQLAKMIRRNEVSSLELTKAYIERIERHDPDINAVVVRRFDEALAEAAARDKQRDDNLTMFALHGVPMTVKESYVMAGTPSTWGISTQRDNVSDTDGLTVQRFKSLGAVFLGKTNVPKDLGDLQSYNDIYGKSNNPYDLSRTPGGSSGGSAAAMAAGFSALEAGSDIGGSIRTPAVFCGVYGHKPTWGIVPQSGHELFPGVPDADVTVCGPIARSPDDLALALDVMARPVPRVATGWKIDLPEPGFNNLSELRAVVWANDELAPVSREIEQACLDVGKALEGVGATVSYTARPKMNVAKSHRVYQSLTSATMSSGQPREEIERLQALVDALEPGDLSPAAVKARASVMSHRDWLRDNFRREQIRLAWDEFFREWDVVICPQQVRTAFEHDHRPFEERTVDVDGDARPYFEGTFWSGLGNVASLPGTAFPVGFASDGLPLGVQVMAAPYQDKKTIAFAWHIAGHLGGFTPPARMALAER